ncbi:VOC family protein [Candidatus Formimonas warabiya]|uniref:Glyoxalase n=1 Tax=Formimonas warabiya TaxID=1761012 RepID=A0A3G1KRL0_FORW1|nr:VOC family protein [Candidatus Formimonas warabiya]ATW25088.1 glyoxalase [Candidatus Formimonas warabiya]
MKYICPLIVVKDIKISRDFYEKLGQKIKYDFGENVEFDGGFSIHLEEHFGKLLGIGQHNMLTKSNNFELYFETEEISRVYEELMELEVEFIHEIREQPWGQRVMRFYDPDYHIIEVGESMESVVVRYYQSGMTIEDICRKTLMPKEFVLKTTGI